MEISAYITYTPAYIHLIRNFNDNLLYINASSDHQPHVIKQLTNSINKRLCENSVNEQVFNTVKPVHENGLHKSGYKSNLKHSEEIHQHSSNKRTRKITWFNPPFSQTVKTKIANLFFRLLNKHFPKSHLLHKIFNRNTIKVSYSCMNNVSKCKNEGSYFYKNKKYRENQCFTAACFCSIINIFNQ